MARKEKQFVKKLAVCSWSLQPASPAELIQQLKAIGLTAAFSPSALDMLPKTAKVHRQEFRHERPAGE